MRFFVKRLVAAIVFTTASAVASAHGSTLGAITIAHPYALPTPPGATTGGAYIKTLTNQGPADDRLVGITTPAAEHVEIHTMSMDGSVMRMREVPGGIPLPAGGHVDMAPGGGYHLMLIGLKQPLKVGDKVPATLRFEKAGTVDVELHVQSRDAASAMPMH